MALVNRGDLRDHLEFVIDANPAQTNVVFTTARLNDALQRAYDREVETAKTQGSKRYFLKFHDETWPANQETLTLPASVGDQFLQLRDVTDDVPGVRYNVGDQAGPTTIHWLDNTTLRWEDNGPDKDRTMRFYYLAVAETLSADGDEPTLIPTKHRELIIWSAAVELREIVDEDAPSSFKRHLQEWQYKYWKHLSRGRPYDEPESIVFLESERERFF